MKQSFISPSLAVIFHSWERASVRSAKGCWGGQILRHVNGYCKDRRRDSRFLCASLCLFPVKGASYTLAAFSESNHTNLIRVVCPRSCSRCWAAVRPLFPYLPRRKVLTCTSSLWTGPFFSSPLTSFTTLFLVSLPPSHAPPTLCLSVATHQWSAFGFTTSQQVRQMTVINYKELLLWCHLSLTPVLCNV